MKMKKLLCLAMGLGMAFSAAACGGNSSTSNNSSTGGGNSGETIKLTVWCPEADREFAKQVAEDYKKANPDKTYKFFFGIQGENDAATKVLNDVTNAPDVFSLPTRPTYSRSLATKSTVLSTATRLRVSAAAVWTR